MAFNNVSTEALEDVAAGLERYISEMDIHIQKMRDAAIDCRDNMGSDKYSAIAIKDLDECVEKLGQAMLDAEELRQDIIRTIIEIEED